VCCSCAPDALPARHRYLDRLEAIVVETEAQFPSVVA
jgi:hypothetical protein